MVVSDLLGSHVPQLQCMVTPEHGRSVQVEASLFFSVLRYRGVTSSRHGLGKQGCGQLIVSDAVILEGWRSRSAGWVCNTSPAVCPQPGGLMMQGISCDAEDSAVTRQHGCLMRLKHHRFCHAAVALNFCHTWTSEAKHVLAMQGRRAMRRSQEAAIRKLPQRWRTPRRGVHDAELLAQDAQQAGGEVC